MKTIFSFLFLFYLSLQVVVSQQVWSLDKCVKYALDNNISIKQQTLSVETSQNSLIQSKADILPSVNASVSHNYNFGRSVDKYTNEYANTTVRSNNFGISASMELFKGFQNYHKIEQNSYNFRSSLQDLEKMKNDISLNIATAYLQILYCEESYTIAMNQRDLSIKQVENTQKLADAGSVAKGNVLELQSQLANDELSVINAQNQLDLAYLTLTQLLDLKDTKNFKIEKPNFPDLQTESIKDTPESIFAQAQQLPQIKSAELKLKSSEHSLSIAQSNRYPSLSLNAGWGSGYSDARKLYEYTLSEPKMVGYLGSNPKELVYAPSYSTTEKNYSFVNQFKDNSNKYIGLQLSIPIFNNWQVQTAVSNSKISMKSAEYTLQTTKNQLYKEIQQAYSDANAALSEYRGSVKALTAMEESFRYTQQKFDVGLISSIDYTTAKNQYIKTLSSVVRAKYQYIFKKNILNFYAGKPIALN